MSIVGLQILFIIICITLIVHIFIFKNYGRRWHKSLPIHTDIAKKIAVKIVGESNPCLIVQFKIGNYHSVFLIDTGFAGAPVLNSSLLTHARGEDIDCDSAMKYAISKKPSEKLAYENLQSFLRSNKCTEYTSGCTLRLMGIGSTEEKASDMLMCSSIMLKNTSGNYVDCKELVNLPSADVFMTNNKMQSPHILTLDYLLHVSPCHLDFISGVLTIGLGVPDLLYHRSNSVFCTDEFSGGSYVGNINIAGATVRCTIDTGASITVSVSKSMLRKMKGYHTTGKSIQQMGINGEIICSDIILADITFCKRKLSDVVVFVNSNEVEDTDGYIGIGLLKAFNLLMTPESLFCHYNGSRVADTHNFSSVISNKSCT